MKRFEIIHWIVIWTVNIFFSWLHMFYVILVFNKIWCILVVVSGWFLIFHKYAFYNFNLWSVHDFIQMDFFSWIHSSDSLGWPCVILYYHSLSGIIRRVFYKMLKLACQWYVGILLPFSCKIIHDNMQCNDVHMLLFCQLAR